MPFLRDFDELVTQQQTKQHETEETDQQQQQTSSSLSERIKALETAGIIDSFVKKRVPPYAAAAAAVGSTLQQSQIDSHSHNHISETKQVTKIYRNPNPISTSNQQQNNHLKTSSSTNLHSSSSRESLASNEVPPGGLVSTLYRSASVDSIENELPVAANGHSRRVSTIVAQNQTQSAQRNGGNNNNNAELPSSFQSELVDRIKTLRKVSSSKDTNIHNQGEIPISIPLEPVNRISISSSASPSPAGLNGGLNKQTDSNSSSSLSSSINNKPNEILPNNEDLYKTSFVIYPESNPPSSRVLRSHSPIGATLDFKIPIPAAATTSSATTTNKTIIHIDSQFMTTATTTTTGASSPASSSCQYSSAANELLLPAASYAKSSGLYSSQCCLEEPLQAIHHHQQHQHHHNHNSNNRSQLLIFNSEYTRTAGGNGMATTNGNQNFHTEHFNCFNCNQSLTGSRYILKEEHPYCIKCYETLFANACKECNKKIGTDSKDLSYKDQHWHEKCFFCHVCKIPLVDKPFGSKNETLYCAECYNQAFASRCDKCAQIFKPGMKKMEYKGQQFHENCFLCFTCASPIGTKSFIPKENKIFCVTCYEQAYATKCTKCAKVISSGGVSYKNLPYHRECFNCTNCQQSLAGQRFTSRDDHPYCSECFGKLFAKKCFSCHKPITGIGGTKYISFEDRHWHNECFICNQCNTSLVGRGFLTDAMDILCPECGRN